MLKYPFSFRDSTLEYRQFIAETEIQKKHDLMFHKLTSNTASSKYVLKCEKFFDLSKFLKSSFRLHKCLDVKWKGYHLPEFANVHSRFRKI